MSANDPDAGQTHTFSITNGNTGGAFAIHPTTGEITVANSSVLDYETAPSFSLTIEVTDSTSLTGSTAVVVNLLNAPEAPVANDEGTPASPYVETVGNTLLEVTAAPTASGAKIVFNGNVLANDFDPDGPATFTVALESATAGAVVTLSSNGTFTYVPPPGFTGVDSFTYRITSSDGSDTATVYINVEHRVWYVKNNAAADGLGRSTDPFDTLAEAESASLAGDTIYLFAGNDSTLGQSDGIVLKSGQRLIGEAIQLAAPAAVNINSVDGPTLRSATGNRPKIENDNAPDAPGEDNGVNVPATEGSVTGVEIRGLEISGFDNAIDVTATGVHNASVTIRDNVVTGASLEGIDVNAGSTGTVVLAIHDNTLTTTGTSIDVQRTAGTAYITAFDDNLVTGDTAGTGINVFGTIFDAVPGGAFDTVGGGMTVIGAPGNGVGQSGLVLSNVQGRLSFADLDVFADNGAGLRASSLTAYTGSAGLQLVVNTPGAAILEATNGPVVDISQTSINLPLGSIKSASSSTTGLALNSSTGSFSAEPGSSISGLTSASGTAFQVGSSSVTLTYKGSISTNQGKGIDLTSNAGSTIDLSGPLTLSTGTQRAFNATGGGTVIASNTSNTLSTTTATALNVASTTIGAGGLKFQSISANGAANGIVLNSTGAAAGLTVAGTGSTDGSGGTIQNTSGDGVVLTNTRFTSLKNMVIGDATALVGQAANATNNIGGSGISMNGADDVSLDNLKITRTATHGIDGTGVTNLTISNSELLNAGDSNEDSALDFSDLNQNNLDGTVQITNTVIDGFAEDGLSVENFSGSLALTVSGSAFSNSANTLCGGSTCSENGIQIRGDGTANYTLTVNGSTQFSAVDGNGILAVSEGTAVTPSVVSVSNTTFSNTTALGIVLFGGTGDATSTIQSGLNFTIGPSVSLTGTKSTAISIQPNGKSVMRGTVSATVNGSQIGRGIEVLSDDASTAVVSILNSTVSNTAFNGIFVSNQNVGKLDIHIRGNNVSAPLDVVPASGLAVHGTEINVRETSVNCLDIANNQSAGNAVSGGAGYRTRQRDTSTFRLERFSGSGTSTTDVQNFLVGQNVSGTASATVSTSYTAVADGFCEEP